MTESILTKEWRNLLSISMDDKDSIIINNVKMELKCMLSTEKDGKLIVGNWEYENNELVLTDVKVL